MKVKICGITSIEDARATVAAGADYLGVILAESPRRVTLAQAVEIVRSVAAGLTTPVLVVRDWPVGQLIDVVRQTAARWLQLHGDEPATLLAELRHAMPGLRLIKAWECASVADSARLRAYLAECDAAGAPPDVVLIDRPKRRRPATADLAERPHGASAIPAGADLVSADSLAQFREIARGIPCPVWLAGGLTPDNVAAAVAHSEFAGVDVAGGVESAPGRKDHAAIQRFIAAVRSASMTGRA